MDNNIYFYLSLLVIPLSVWRIANMLADFKQYGPFGILDKMRLAAGLRYDAYSSPILPPGSLIEGMSCVYCNSTWIGLAFTILLFISPEMAFYLALPMALSAIAVLIERHING